VTPLYEATIAATGIVPDAALTHQPDDHTDARATGVASDRPDVIQSSTVVLDTQHAADLETTLIATLDPAAAAGHGGLIWDPDVEADAAHTRAAAIYPNLARNAPHAAIHIGLICALVITASARIFTVSRWR
jgi:hypothetical protein